MTVEQELLAALSPLPNQATDFSRLSADDTDRFLALVEQHRLGPLLHHKLSDRDQVAGVLAGYGAEATGRNLALCAAIAGIADAFQRDGLPLLPFKGPLLAEKLHGNLAARDCYDIDLLVPAAQVGNAVRALTSVGYQPEDIPVTKHERLWRKYRHEQAFTHAQTDQRVELHWRVMPGFFPFDLTIAQLITEAQERKWEKRLILELPNEILLILLCAHGTRHCWSELPWVVDIATLMTRAKLDWQQIMARAKDLGAIRMIQLGIALAAQLPGVEPPPNLPALPTDLAALRDSVVEAWWLLDDSHQTNREYQFLATCRERSSDRTRMWWRLIFQPTQADFEWLDLPSGLDWAYPLIRPLRLILGRT